MPSSSSRKKVAPTTTTSSTASRPSILDTMLLTSTPLRRSPVPSSMHSTRSATNLTLQQIFKEKNQTYEDMQLLKMAKSRNKKEKKSSSKATTTSSGAKTLRKRSRSRKSMVAEEQDDEEDETENDEEVATRKKHHRSKQKAADEPQSKKLRRTAQKAIGSKRKSSAGSSDGGTSAEEEQEETRLIEQSKLYIEGPGVRQNYKKVNEHNAKIGEKLQNLHGHSTSAPTNATTLPSPILSRSAQHASPVKIKTASRITFALPAPVITSPVPPPLYDPVHPPSPQMPPSNTAMSVETQTDDRFSRHGEEKECQTGPMEIQHQSVQTEGIDKESSSVGIQCQSSDHLVCRDLTVCTCVEQLVKTRQFLLDTTTKLQLPASAPRSVVKVSKQTMTMDEITPSMMVLAKSSLKAEQQMIFEQFLSHFQVGYSATINDTTTHLITDALDENTPLVCPLTLKVIQATARHLPIISVQWLVASLTHQTIVPSQIYEIFLGDPTYGYHGGFLRSRIPRSQGLFQGIAFRLDCPEEHGCPALLADNRALRELIELCAGTIIDDSHSHSTEHASNIIVVCHELKRRDPTFTAYVRPEWLLASIAQYNLQPFHQFSVHFSS